MRRRARPDAPHEDAAIDGAVRLARARLGVLAVCVGLLWLAIAVVVGLDARATVGSVANVEGAGLVLLALAIALLTIPLFPAPLLAAGAGYAAGGVVGGSIALAGLSAGAMACAALARAASAGHGAGALWQRAEPFAAWYEQRPFRALVVTRLIPGIPFHLTSYAAGLARVPLPTVGAATAVGFGPRCFLFAVLGGSIGNLDQPETRIAAAATIALLAATVLLPRHPAVARRLAAARGRREA